MKTKFTKILLVSLLALLGQSNVANSQSQWVQTNTPPGGSVWAMETIGNNLFAGTASGGVYFSNDDGASWIQRNGAFPSMQVFSLVVSGTDIYAGTGGSFGAGVYKSSDNGLNWTNVTPSTMNTFNAVRSLAVNGTNIFAGTDGGIFMSLLSGISSSSWSSFNTGLTNQNIRSLKIKGITIYAGTYGNGVWISPTNSPNWSLTSSTMPVNSDYIQALDVSGTSIYAGNISGLPVLYNSSDNGITWIQSNTSIFNDKPVYAINSSANNVYVGTEGEGIFLSTDNGLTWSSYNQGFQDNFGNWFCNQINVRSIIFSGSNIFTGTDCGVWKRAVNPCSEVETITGTLSACIGSTTQLTGSPTAHATTPWTSSNTAVATIDINGLVTGVAAGTTTITFMSTNGCTITATVTINASPTITASGATTFCQGGSVDLTSSSTTGNTWSNGATTQSITVTTSGNYSVSVSNGSCSLTSNIISVNTSPIPQQPTTACYETATFNTSTCQWDVTGSQPTLILQPSNQNINSSSNAQFMVGSSDPSATYQWQTDLGVGFQNLNSVGQYSGTTTETLTVSNVTMSNNNQPFRCIVSSGSCSDTSNVAVLTVNNNVGINETSKDKLFSVFPNPAQSIIKVKVDNKLIGYVYTIYDNTGRNILTGKLNSQNTTIELGNLSGGVYMFSVGENLEQTFKVIKE
jgi:hypothetical protein